MKYTLNSDWMKKINTATSLGLLISLAVILFGSLVEMASANALNRSNTMSSLRVNTLSNHTIVFRTPTGVDASTDTITITFPAGFAMGTFALLNFDLAASAGGQSTCPAGGATPTYTERTLATTPAAGTWGVAQSGQTVTFTAPTDAAAGNIPTNACVRILIGSNATHGGAGATQITNHATAGTYTMTIGGTFGDSGNILVTLLTNDQVAVSATVSESLSFSLGANTLALGTLTSTAVSSASHTVTLATNAANGLVLTYSGTTLTSGAHTIDAMSTAAASSPGTEQFGLNLRANTTPSIGADCTGSAPIAAAATNYNTVNQFRFVSGDTIVSSSGGINSTTCTISYIANVAGATEAGNYATTLTYTATAQF
jgi:surface adhesion protein